MLKEEIKHIHRIDLNLMEQCIDIAKKSNMRSKHGCIIVDSKGNLISSGYNKNKSIIFKHIDDKIIRDKKCFSSHAEETAIKHADRQKLKGAKLYVVRWGANNTNPYFMYSKPCSKCTSIINTCMNKYGLKAAYYSTDLDIFQEC